jgi:hypothetical protein
VRRASTLVALQIDLDQIGMRHLFEHQTGVDEKVLGTGEFSPMHWWRHHIIPAITSQSKWRATRSTQTTIASALTTVFPSMTAGLYNAFIALILIPDNGQAPDRRVRHTGSFLQ